MKKRILTTLLAAVTAFSMLTLTGCSLNLDGLLGGNDNDLSAEEESLSAEPEGEINGSITLHTRWYDYDDTKLANANISITNGSEIVYSGTTDDTGHLEVFDIPANTELTVKVTASSGQPLAETDLICHMSYDFDSFMIYPIHTAIASSEGSVTEVETDVVKDGKIEINVPADRSEVSTSIFLTNNGLISIANMYAYTETESIAENDAAVEDISGDIGEIIATEEIGSNPTEGYANQGDINVRASAVDGEAVGYLVEGQTVTISDQYEAYDGKTWYAITFVQDGGELNGWVCADFITISGGGDTPAVEEAPAEEAPVEEAPVEEAPVEEAPAE